MGLILLRIAVAWGAGAYGASTIASRPGGGSTLAGVLAVALGLMVCVGFLTPVAGLASSLGWLVMSVAALLSADADKWMHAQAAFLLTDSSVALVLLGPGAYSLDGRMFGRREIIIPESRRPPIE